MEGDVTDIYIGYNSDKRSHIPLSFVSSFENKEGGHQAFFGNIVFEIEILCIGCYGT